MTHDPAFDDQENPYAAPKPDLTQPIGPSGLFEPKPARVRFDAIGEAWSMIRQNMGTWVLISLVFYAVVIGAAMAAGMAQLALTAGAGGFPPAAGAANAPVTGRDILIQIVLTFFQWFVQSYMMAGFFRAACKQARGELPAVGDLFSAGDVTLRYFGAYILYVLAIFLGLLLLIIPGFLVAGRLMFVQPLIADGRLRIGEAFDLSWRSLKGQTWASAGFVFVAGFLSGLGILLCCVGVLVTLPLMYLPVAILYRDFFMAKPKVESPWAEPI